METPTALMLYRQPSTCEEDSEQSLSHMFLLEEALDEWTGRSPSKYPSQLRIGSLRLGDLFPRWHARLMTFAACAFERKSLLGSQDGKIQGKLCLIQRAAAWLLTLKHRRKTPAVHMSSSLFSIFHGRTPKVKVISDLRAEWSFFCVLHSIQCRHESAVTVTSSEGLPVAFIRCQPGALRPSLTLTLAARIS